MIRKMLGATRKSTRRPVEFSCSAFNACAVLQFDDLVMVDKDMILRVLSDIRHTLVLQKKKTQIDINLNIVQKIQRLRER